MDEVKLHVVEVMAYEPPTIEDVPLHPDEQVVAGCKTASGNSPGVAGAAFCFQCTNTANS
jgi:hypothetical protein